MYSVSMYNLVCIDYVIKILSIIHPARGTDGEPWCPLFQGGVDPALAGDRQR